MAKLIIVFLAFVSVYWQKPNAKKTLLIVRTEYGETGVKGYGVLLDADGNKLTDFYTLERSWKDNKPFQSCIPLLTTTAAYRSPSESQKIDYPHLILEDVPERNFILIHKANTATQLEGCIAVGKSIKKIVGIPTLLQSDEAMQELMSCVDVGERLDFVLKEIAKPNL